MRRDVHPAEVLMPDGSMLTGVRVFVTSHRVIVYAHEGDFKRVAELELLEPGVIEANRGTLGSGRLECRTPEGTAWVNQGRGCGCGSKLKALGTPVAW